jgi:MFS family permease
MTTAEPAADPWRTTDHNVRMLVIEIFWAAIAIGGYSFASAYLLRLGGTNLQVSLLTSAGALVNAVCSIPFALWLQRRPDRWRWTIASLWVMRSLHVGLIAIPWLPAWQPEAIVVLLLVINLPLALFNVGWLPIFGVVVPLARRARLFSARNMTLNVTVMLATFGAGLWLDVAGDWFPLNYQLMFVVALITGTLSTIFVARLRLPEDPGAAAAPLALGDIGLIMRTNRPFTNMTVNTLVFNIAFWMGTPLQPIYFVRELGATEGWLGLWIGLISGGAIVGNLFWPRLIERRGFVWVLSLAATLSALYYIAIGLVPNLTLILVFAFLFGMVSPGVDISHFSTLLELCDPARRTLMLSIFVAIMNAGFFCAALAAAPLLDLVNPYALVVALGVLRLIGAAMFRLNPVGVASLGAATDRSAR